MAMTIKLKHVDQLANGSLRFRRKFPKRLAEALNLKPMQIFLQHREGEALHREYAATLAEFDRRLKEYELRMGGADFRRPAERWEDAKGEVMRLVEGAQGLEDDPQFARELIYGDLSQRKGVDPYLVEALRNPQGNAPEATLEDARRCYEKDKGYTEDHDAMIRQDRICRRLEAALGPLKDIRLRDLERDHGRKLMESLLATPKKNGEALALGSCQREATIVAAMVNHAFVEFDIGNKRNPFEGLPWPKTDDRAVDKREPLPDDLVAAVQRRLERGRTTELPLMWKMIAATGMRVGESCGLVHDDIDLSGEVPCLHIRPNALRGVKTSSSIRTIPLVGQGLDVARQLAREGHPKDAPLFPRYAGSSGPTKASAALMRAVKKETAEERMTVHGLRHRASDKLRDAGAPEGIRHGFLGHSSSAIAETTYGSAQARLREFHTWALKAGL